MPEVHENILKIGDSDKMPLSQIGDTCRIAVPAGRAPGFDSEQMSRAP